LLSEISNCGTAFAKLLDQAIAVDPISRPFKRRIFAALFYEVRRIYCRIEQLL
jgi:hypothetical protein